MSLFLVSANETALFDDRGDQPLSFGMLMRGGLITHGSTKTLNSARANKAAKRTLTFKAPGWVRRAQEIQGVDLLPMQSTARCSLVSRRIEGTVRRSLHSGVSWSLELPRNVSI